MPVRHIFVYEWPEGVQPITFDKWIQSLSQTEKQEFFEAKQRQINYRTQAIDRQLMAIDHGTYVWADEQSALLNKPTDPVWYRYFQRYLADTQTKFKVEEEKC